MRFVISSCLVATCDQASSFLSSSALRCCSRALEASSKRTFASLKTLFSSGIASRFWFKTLEVCWMFSRHVSYSSLNWLSCVPRRKNYKRRVRIVASDWLKSPHVILVGGSRRAQELPVNNISKDDREALATLLPGRVYSACLVSKKHQQY